MKRAEGTLKLLALVAIWAALLAAPYWMPLLGGYTALGTRVLVLGLAAMSVNFLLGFTGVLSFGHAAYFGLGAYGAGFCLKFLAPSTPLSLLCGMLLGGIAGALLGALAAFNRGTVLDKLFSAAAITGVSLPHYWVGIVLVAIFAVILNALPAQGMGPAGIPTSWEQIQHLILPVVTLSLIPMGVVSRLVRANVLEILSHEYVGALDAKGLLRRRVLYHVMKNAAPSALALMGLQLGYLLAGSILVETVFNWPGSGGLMNLAIFRRDIPVLSATILVLATIFVVINILVDVLQALIDPRMRR